MKFSTIYLVHSLIILSFQIVNCDSEPQNLYLDTTYQITQNQTAENFQINIFSVDPRFNYLIIQIDVISPMYPVYKFVACLNFNQNNLDQQSQQYTELNACQFIDTLATQQQLSQHLLIIQTNYSDYSTRTPTFLTILYTQKFNDNTVQNLQSLHQIQYNVKIYQDYLYPCHKNCNQQGYCDNQLGKCTCESQFYGIDCSVQLNALNISETQNITISSMEQRYFILQFEDALTKSNGKKLPSIFNNNISQKIQTNEIITILSLEQKYEPTMLSISAQYSQQTISQQNSSEQSKQDKDISQIKIIIIIIIVVVTLSVFLLCIFIFVLVKMRKRRASTQNRLNQNLQRPNNEYFQIKVDVTKAKILFLQEAFMPIVQYDSFKKQNEINIIQIRQDNQMIKKEQNQNEQNFTENMFIIKDRIEGDQQQNIGKDRQNQDKNSKDQNTKEDIQVDKDNTNNCSICLVEIVTQDELRLTICRHLFHSNCLISWISQNDSCPLCRQSFAIIDIIDYLITQKINQNATKEQVADIQSQKDKILEVLSNEKNKQLTISDFELLNIFKYFLPFETLQKYQLIQKKKCSIYFDNTTFDQSPTSMLMSNHLSQQFRNNFQTANQTESLIQERRVSIFH
ncbi:anaphase-promoting complex subunit 11 RING-H2 finger protein (macronuclear) [Tetrahymena thermophila SB210]|uniref:Anaphase-promoting complex subunit 11 RING-H2 finger protein n=1 Tax=Tetrahymena thermophila (strain SB210) TaxID=312017 RepID=Q22Z48_TETTS|nr:anaphase-promoting complex subunit 11 RING-H2 finger protein [Tetrahymena thermophila SB210]EAR90473.2 anaphase-promoting complex subunit 11 RING-H2 finger protein [Tetrahymena thermophila SB210]|eukprot:XP_001010718.2 anaphase-promoting complex subunit 11 RING-H2 finger protein [Tetrahymena thermophila SB210]